MKDLGEMRRNLPTRALTSDLVRIRAVNSVLTVLGVKVQTCAPGCIIDTEEHLGIKSYGVVKIYRAASNARPPLDS